MKRIALVALAASLSVGLTGCGKQSSDVGKWGVLELPGGQVIEGYIDSLTRWSSSSLEVEIDSVTYSTHPMNFACYEKS